MEKYYTIIAEMGTEKWWVQNLKEDEAYVIAAKDKDCLFEFFHAAAMLGTEISLSGACKKLFVFGTDVYGEDIADMEKSGGNWIYNPTVYNKQSLAFASGNALINFMMHAATKSCPTLIITRTDINPFFSMGLKTSERTFFKDQRLSIDDVAEIDITRSPIYVAEILLPLLKSRLTKPIPYFFGKAGFVKSLEDKCDKLIPKQR